MNDIPKGTRLHTYFDGRTAIIPEYSRVLTFGHVIYSAANCGAEWWSMAEVLGLDWELNRKLSTEDIHALYDLTYSLEPSRFLTHIRHQVSRVAKNRQTWKSQRNGEVSLGHAAKNQVPA